MPFNLPNQITISRLVLAVVFFSVIGFYRELDHEQDRWLLDVSTVLFGIAAITDWLDGFLARRRNQVTAFGRILDPFVDKVLICGAFAYFAGSGFIDESGENVTGVRMWMVMVIFGRELLVTGLRGFTEARGGHYAASISGKTKMVVQTVTALIILITVARRDVVFGSAFNDGLREVLVWMTVVVTAFSMVSYLWRSKSILLEQPGA